MTHLSPACVFFLRSRDKHWGINQMPGFRESESKAWDKVGVKSEGRLFIFCSASRRVFPFPVSTIHALLIMLTHPGD